MEVRKKGGIKVKVRGRREGGRGIRDCGGNAEQNVSTYRAYLANSSPSMMWG